MKIKSLIIAVFLFFQVLSANGEVFRFKYIEGDKYRILSKVNEDVYINGVFSHRAEILNKISIHISKVKDKAGYLEAEFQTSERSAGESSIFTWSEYYRSEFLRDERGYFDIENKYYMPVVRNVPAFPERNIIKGESWAAEGEEVHDLRNNFNITEPFRFPIWVTYKYLGREKKDGKEYDVISIKYNVFYKVKNIKRSVGMYPVRISGYSDQIFLWDNHLGRSHSYRESFDIFFTFSTGDEVEYVGEASAEIIESSIMNREKIAEKIRQKLLERGVSDTAVKTEDRGVTITLENIQFLPDSTVLISSEKEKLTKIGEILKEYPDRDILITGHTALAGTEEGRRRLSELRARTVAEYLLFLGVRREEQMVIQGMGADKPVADNSTEEGQRKNRRVEITILEN